MIVVTLVTVDFKYFNKQFCYIFVDWLVVTVDFAVVSKYDLIADRHASLRCRVLQYDSFVVFSIKYIYIYIYLYTDRILELVAHIELSSASSRRSIAFLTTSSLVPTRRIMMGR